MTRHLFALILSMSLATPAFAVTYGEESSEGGGLSEQTPVVVNVQLSTAGDDYVFKPNALTFKAGKLYKLVLKNPSKLEHYFSALEFAAAVWTRKVEVGGAEIKGMVREIELKPGGEAEWFFVPVKAGEFHLQCTKPGHADWGMVGTITVQ